MTARRLRYTRHPRHTPHQPWHDGARMHPCAAPAQDVARWILGRAWWARFTFNGITRCERGSYALVGGDELSDPERDELLQLCRHRTPISGSIKVRVLTRARGRCECCGAHEHQRALEVDHIVPKNQGGSDDPSNLQALCFCGLQASRWVLLENELAVCIADAYLVTPGHSLVIPRRHVGDGLTLHQPEWNAVVALLKQRREQLSAQDASINKWNVGLNSGESAGQTVFHAHWHLIPRRQGDCAEQRGGVRAVIPGQQSY